MVIKELKHYDDYKIDGTYIENMLSKIYADLNKWRKRLQRQRTRKRRSKKLKKTYRKRPRRKFKQKSLKGGDSSVNKIGGSSPNKYYSKILNPATGSFVNTTSKVGQTLLNNYLNVLAHH